MIVKYMYAIIIIVCLLASIITKNIEFILIDVYIVITMITLVLVYSIHEYIHIYIIKKFEANASLKITITWYSFSIHDVKVKFTQNINIFIALMPNAVLLIFGLCLLQINKIIFENILIINIISYICIISVINLLPIFGDGKTILKNIRRKKND
ncbi:MAG: metalloprotease family protein [Bacilli bacterium]